MKLLDYLKIDQVQLDEYVNQRLIDVAYHNEFPLEMLTYGREAVHQNLWDEVTTKCRGLIYNKETGDIVARPFEKFFNLGTEGMAATQPAYFEKAKPPEVQEKMDGFLCTMYAYKGKEYIASKGSFHSVHAKWATAVYTRGTSAQKGHPYIWPEGYTPVFEGITPNLRIVVDYGTEEKLVLLALVNIETGEELSGHELNHHAAVNGFTTPRRFEMSWEEASIKSLGNETNFEGYVLVWRLRDKPPFRLKVKFVDYLRLHRMVCGVSPKAVFNVLAGVGWAGEMNVWLDESVPWFNKFVSKWKNALEGEYKRIEEGANIAFDEVHAEILKEVPTESYVRKHWALKFQQPKYDGLQAALFARLDGKDAAPVIWKMVKPMIRNSKPLVDARQ